MPLIKRKPVELLPPPDPPKEGEPEPDVYYLAATGEIFNDYDSYTNRLAYFNQTVFQCELTGRVNMTYFQATDSERQEAIMLHRRFPESLKGPILRSVQFTITGRLDDLINTVHDRFVDRYFAGEQVYVDLSGERYYASIKTVYPPRSLLRQHQEAALAAQRRQRKAQHPDSDSDLTDEEPEYPPVDAESVVHRIGTDLNIEIAKANGMDNPEEYLYAIQLVDDDGKFTGSLMEARAKALRRDRLTFSKTILKKYLKEAAVRETSVGSPWVIRHVLAQKYGIPINPSDETLRKNKETKDAKLGKRKKALTKEEEEALANPDHPSKKKKGKSATGAEGDANPPEKKKVIKYPIEDLDNPPISEKELKYTSADGIGRIRSRPVPSRALPISKEIFEPFMMVYYFCIAVGKPLALSPFTLDDFEASLRHNTHEPACTLISEIHASLLNCIMRDGSFSKDLAPAAMENKANAQREKKEEKEKVEKGRSASRGRSEETDQLDSDHEKEEDKDKSRDEKKEKKENGDDDDDDDDDEELSDEEITDEQKSVQAAAAVVGRGWDKRILRPEDGRPGWERGLVGCLLKRATTSTLPRLIGILSQLTGVAHPEGAISRPDGIFDCHTYESEVQRYPTLTLGDKLAAMQFLCELAVMTKAVRGYFDECEANLTELRKEKLDFTRVRKKVIEDRTLFEATKESSVPPTETTGTPTPAASNGDAKVGANGDTSMKAADVSVSKASTSMVADSDSEKDELASDNDEDELDAALDDDLDDDDSMSESIDGSGRPTSRQAKLREQTLKKRAEEKSRDATMSAEKKKMAAKNSFTKARRSELQRLEDEETRSNRREEIFERDYRKYINAARMRPLGKDRFHDSYWWFDGVGNTNLIQAGQVLYNTGRIFVQGPSQDDWEMLQRERNINEIEERKKVECHPEGVLGIGEWAVYEESEEIDSLIAWLRNKGRRELALRTELLKFRNYIEPGMKKRKADCNAELAAAESRRSTRKYEKQSYMLYKNMIAK